MDTPQPTKRTRGKGKSSLGSEKPEKVDAENAPNVNGDKDGEAMEASFEKGEVSKDKETKSTEPGEVKAQGRKRKASEMKVEDSIDEDAMKIHKSIDESSSMDDDEGGDSREEPTSGDFSPEGKDDLSLPPKQTFGKGKRARIPNKRYSDISIGASTPKAEFKKRVENGESVGKENDTSDNITNISPPKIKESPPTPMLKKPKMSVDLSNPNYLKPFQFGWKRELVYRATSDTSMKRNGDIYYYTPGGKKVRSMREVSENLKEKELTLDDFTFFKEPLGIDDPEKEIIRDAKLKSSIGAIPKKTMTPKTPKTPKPTSPKLAPAAMTPTADAPKSKASPRVGGFKVKFPSKGEKSNKVKSGKKVNKEDEDMEMGMYPPNWASPAKKSANKWKNIETPEKKKSSRIAAAKKIDSTKTEENRFMDNYMQNLSFGYSALMCIFQYLKVSDLLRAGCVCTMWRDIASHASLWKTVRMKNSQVHSFEGLAKTLKKHGTQHLDLRKMLLPNSGDDIWPLFSDAIKQVESLRKIELCRCPASVVEQLAETNPNLHVLNAVTIKCEFMTLDPLKNLKDLQELRLKSTTGLTLSSDLTALRELQQLKHLSLTSIKDLNKLNIEVIAELSNLEALDLGECTDFPKSFGSEILTKLDKLEKLRLEKGQGNCYTFEILEAVKSMTKLEQLELVNFDIKAGFDKALGSCVNIKKLLIIPTYISQSATTNHMVLGGVLRLQNTLSHFVWGVTLELLRVTELFVDQCEDPDKKDKKDKKPSGNGDSIPVLKPVPLLGESGDSTKVGQDPPQVEILPLPNLQKLLLQNLPTTRVKILKIPFHATWRQSITDTVN